MDLPDGLLHFRNNLLELLVDICQLLHPTTFVSKVCPHFTLQKSLVNSVFAKRLICIMNQIGYSSFFFLVYCVTLKTAFPISSVSNEFSWDL